MQGIHKVLVAVKNPDSARQPGVEKALRIAQSLGASVELFHALSSPVFLELEPLTGQSIAELRREALELRKRRLEKLVAKARRLGVAATATVDWDFPPHEAIVRRTIRSRAHLVIAECHAGRRLAPWLVHLTDWELLRSSPVPVLLLKNAKPWRRNRIVAAVDPSHARAKPTRLDAQIVSQAKQLAARLGGALHLVHANVPSVVGLTLGDPAVDAAMLAMTYEEQRQIARRNFATFAREARIPRARQHLMDASPEFAIAAAARKVGADLVVMGAVSRSGLKRVFIGNTAERVLNELPCDVLVVKPAHFEKRVSEKPRGMRVIPPQPILPLPV